MTGLICNKCGAEPLLGTSGHKVGGTHYSSHVRAAEPRKTEGRFQRLTACGQWRAREPGEEG